MLLISKDSNLFQPLQNLVNTRKLIFLAGLPGTGKSLLLQQLAILAHNCGRRPHLLQWDVCRLPFLTNAHVMTHYHEKDGITHAGVRKAVGMWARLAVKNWTEEYAGCNDILIGETPIIGNRLVELVRQEPDSIEPILVDAKLTFFGIPTPSWEVRQLIEMQRKARSTNPLHEREKGDAEPDIMYKIWEELHELALHFGLIEANENSKKHYNPDLYFRTYSVLLKHRPAGGININKILPTEGRSVYDLSVGQIELVPSEKEVESVMDVMEKRYSQPGELGQSVDKWYEV